MPSGRSELWCSEKWQIISFVLVGHCIIKTFFWLLLAWSLRINLNCKIVALNAISLKQNIYIATIEEIHSETLSSLAYMILHVNAITSEICLLHPLWDFVVSVYIDCLKLNYNIILVAYLFVFHVCNVFQCIIYYLHL